MKTTTVKPREFSASEITVYALKVLDLQDFECWRANNLAVKGRKFIGRRGASDIQGFHRRNGKMMACEVKKIGDTIKTDQEVFLGQVKKSGAMALIATQKGREIVIEPFVPKP